MARRASSGPNISAIIGIAAFVIIALVGAKIFLGGKSDKMKGGTPLSMQEFLDNGNSLRGNEYVVSGTVDQRWPRDNGQLVSLLVDDSKDLIGIEIPATFDGVNIERLQKLTLKVKFREGGVPVATEIARQ